MTELENYQTNPEYQIALPSVTSFVEQSQTSSVNHGQLNQSLIQPNDQQLIVPGSFLQEVKFK